jgi:hypothetical protein
MMALFAEDGRDVVVIHTLHVNEGTLSVDL